MKLTPKKIGVMLSKVAMHEDSKKGVKFIAELIVKSGKTGKMGVIVESFKKNYNKETNTTDILITTSDEHSVPHLSSGLKELGGKKVSIKNVIDPSLLGGMKIQTEDFLVDNTIFNKINKLKNV